jgi:ABC-type transport system substrate-binding protein
MPTVEDNGRTYLCKVRKGIYFTPDPAFKGRRRELTAADFAYGFERVLDPAVKSPWLWLLEGKLLGGDEARARAEKAGRFDYDAPLPGLEVVDRYTLRIRLTRPDLRFPYALAVPNMAAHVEATFWFVLPSLPMFLLIPWILRSGFGFWTSLLAGCALTILCYLAMTWIGPRFGLKL